MSELQNRYLRFLQRCKSVGILDRYLIPAVGRTGTVNATTYLRLPLTKPRPHRRAIRTGPAFANAATGADDRECLGTTRRIAVLET